jgi:APA family basic amino acid/polyamine antiporter
MMSVLFCFLLMAGLPILTWIRFFLWLVVGLAIYFLFSRHNSTLAGQ